MILLSLLIAYFVSWEVFKYRNENFELKEMEREKMRECTYLYIV